MSVLDMVSEGVDLTCRVADCAGFTSSMISGAVSKVAISSDWKSNIASLIATQVATFAFDTITDAIAAPKMVYLLEVKSEEDTSSIEVSSSSCNYGISQIKQVQT
mmetsp:Transcript_4565/g.6913  ORF Transcript_4565/g.6913 Transcript_4565/m.6913 type:complete len:105 (-) Transcript_4565:984-1298(-)